MTSLKRQDTEVLMFLAPSAGNNKQAFLAQVRLCRNSCSLLNATQYQMRRLLRCLFLQTKFPSPQLTMTSQRMMKTAQPENLKLQELLASHKLPHKLRELRELREPCKSSQLSQPVLVEVEGLSHYVTKNGRVNVTAKLFWQHGYALHGPSDNHILQ
jgi:hypothetical protein